MRPHMPYLLGQQHRITHNPRNLPVEQNRFQQSFELPNTLLLVGTYSSNEFCKYGIGAILTAPQNDVNR